MLRSGTSEDKSFPFPCEPSPPPHSPPLLFPLPTTSPPRPPFSHLSTHTPYPACANGRGDVGVCRSVYSKRRRRACRGGSIIGCARQSVPAERS